MNKQITALTTLAVITIAWIGIAVMPDDEPDDNSTTVVEPAPDPPVTDSDDPDESAPDDPAEPVVLEREALTVRAALSHPMMQPSGTSDTHAELIFEATDVEPRTRPPLDVALVVDRSGSMRGDPMARARDAARTFVDKLEPGDRISLISFDDRVDVEVPTVDVEDNHRLLHDAIDGLRARGATNISGGLRAGYQQLDEQSRPDSVERVVLMTDGIPNRGITDLEGLSNKTSRIQHNGVTVSTLGFGSDYDAELLASMAAEGAGNFSHVSDAADLQRAFTDEIDDLESTVASGLEAEIRPADGVDLGDIYGFNVEQLDDGKRITLGDLEADGRRSAVVSLDAAPDDVASGDLRDLLDVQTRWTDRIADQRVTEQFALQTRITDDRHRVDETVDGSVVARVEQQRTLQSLDEVRDRYQSGDRAGARELLEDRRRQLEETRRQHDIDEDNRAIGGASGALDATEETVEQHAPGSPAAAEGTADSQETELQLLRGE